MTTLERLDEWKAVGTISEAQHGGGGRSGGAGAGGSF